MKAWGGRFKKETADLMDDFHSSIHFDNRLALEDIQGSIAHARMLGDCGIVMTDEADRIILGLQRIRETSGSRGSNLEPGAEDIHMNIEKLLIIEIGELGKNSIPLGAVMIKSRWTSAYTYANRSNRSRAS